MGSTPMVKRFMIVTNVPTGGLSLCDSIWSELFASGSLVVVIAVAVAVAVAAGSSTGTTWALSAMEKVKEMSLWRCFV